MGERANEASQDTCIREKIRIIEITNSTISRMSSFRGVNIRCTNATTDSIHVAAMGVGQALVYI